MSGSFLRSKGPLNKFINWGFLIILLFSEGLGRSAKETEIRVNELEKENQSLHQKNQFVIAKYQELKGKYDDLVVVNCKLQKFEPSFNKLQEKLPNYSVEKLIDKFEYLETLNLDFVRKIGEFEDEKVQAENELKRQREGFYNEIHDISKKNYENERYIESLRNQMQTQESELQVKDNFKASYFTLFKKILHIFNLYAGEIPVYFNQKDQEEPKANMEDPLEMLEILEKLIAISSKEKMTGYLRKIIINANSLQRKFFPDKVNERFNPERIYERITTYIEQLKDDILKQKTEINNLRVALEKEKSKMVVKCEEKAKNEKRARSAKTVVVDQDPNNKERRNAFL